MFEVNKIYKYVKANSNNEETYEVKWVGERKVVLMTGDNEILIDKSTFRYYREKLHKEIYINLYEDGSTSNHSALSTANSYKSNAGSNKVATSKVILEEGKYVE